MEMAEAFRNLHLDVKILDILPAPGSNWERELVQYVLEEIRKHEVEFLSETVALSIEPGSECRLSVKKQGQF